jgi:hypothetical protein
LPVSVETQRFPEEASPLAAEKAGWLRVGGEEGPTAWSGWTFEGDGEGWVETLVAMRPSGPSEVCFVRVGASAVPEDMR